MEGPASGRPAIMRQGDLGAFLRYLAASWELFVPVDDGGVTRYAPADLAGVRQATDPRALPAPCKRPLKELFFPQAEALFAFDSPGATRTTGGAREGSQAEVRLRVHQEASAPGSGSRVVFGARPCDARSLTLLDLVFDGADYQDPYYVARRRQTAVVTIACSAPGTACFCTSVGGGPFDETGSDIVLAEIAGEVFGVVALSAMGEKLLQGFNGLEEAEDDLVEASRKARLEAEERMAICRSALPDTAVSEAVAELRGAFGHPAWDGLHRKCLGCAVCTYLCPTCHCFDIGDEATKVGGERVRNWDSCMFPLFTLHASGRNPRPSRKERFRQRIMHKFNYFVENNGCVACVGCGRCVENCPVNLDIRRVIECFAGR